MTVEPICASCYAPMITVAVHHANGRTTTHPLCTACVTGRHLDLMDLPIEPVTDGGRHLRAVQ